MTSITPILLAGGSGTRLWPSSRKAFPKQFIQLSANETLFQQSAQRVLGSNFLQFNQHMIITNSDFRFIVREQLQNVGINPGRIIIEPQPKNTAPAIIAATIFAQKDNKDAVIITTPTDHVISDTEKFHQAIKIGLNEIENGKIVTFGISPSHPETGYGYIQLDKSSSEGPRKVLKFIEKPNEILAKKMLDEDNYFWNSGIFMFRANDMIAAFELYAKNIISNVVKSVDQSVDDLFFTKLDRSYWSNLKAISIDYAIMEKAKNLVAIPYSSGWSDLGNWDSVWQESRQDDNGVALSENAHAIECKNTLLRSESTNQEIVGLGLEDIVAISMPDAVLVANKNKSQDVKKVVEYLKSQNISQSEEFTKDYRPWGSFEILSEGIGFKVKKISVKPGAALSLQSHKHRSEHWVVVEGSAVVTIDESVKVISPGQSTYVPLGSIHRLENKEKNMLIIIEIQIGVYLGEDDIIRYEDVYLRK
ncbi:mannose-1-phosphate guanylyltransferase/mannose-6-phosphate isomerase [Alphaproteobacteria bacterium]|nr:mannose-1-phosphate guanylyltransferase/mannose-6-phosphate isomerase [Alphaproteobacteria bacterium]